MTRAATYKEVPPRAPDPPGPPSNASLLLSNSVIRAAIGREATARPQELNVPEVPFPLLRQEVGVPFARVAVLADERNQGEEKAARDCHVPPCAVPHQTCAEMSQHLARVVVAGEYKG
jgi:hypothetical protein